MPNALSADSIYGILKSGTGSERREMVQTLPPDPMRDMALALLDADSPGIALVALGPVTINYCNGRDPQVGAELAFALHRLAFELYQSAPDHSNLLPTTLSGFAYNYVNALNLRGRSQDVVTFADRYI